MRLTPEQRATERAIKKAADDALRQAIYAHMLAHAPLVCPLHDNLEQLEFADCDCPSSEQQIIPDIMLMDVVVVTSWVDPASLDEGCFTRSMTVANNHVALGLLMQAAEVVK